MNGISSVFRDIYDLTFQVTPIILTGGGLGFPLPIIALVGQAAAFAQGLATNGNVSPTDFYANFSPAAGNTVINNGIATYPFANQQIAANAIVEQPNPVSLIMDIPVRDTGGYLTKLAIFTALQTSFRNHNNAGGTYDVLTPAYPYFNCVMTGFTDITPEDSKQKQIKWQLDFSQPLISTSDANAAFSNQMSKISNGSYLPSSNPTGV